METLRKPGKVTRERIKEYDVIHDSTGIEYMIKKVNKAIKEGWRPLGGV